MQLTAGPPFCCLSLLLPQVGPVLDRFFATMIFDPSYVRRADSLDASVRPVLKQSATSSDGDKYQPREDPPKWSTLQQIPSPDDRLKLLNEYFLSSRPTSKKQVVVGKKYTTTRVQIGLLLNAIT